MKNLVSIPFLYFFVLISVPLSAQYSIDSLDLNGDVISWFDNQIGPENIKLIFGSHQVVERISPKYFPFYPNETWSEGSISYRGHVHTGVRLLYNVQHDYIVLQHPTSLAFRDQPIKLMNGKIDWFQLNGFKFKYYPFQILQYEPGLFEQLYLGKNISLIVKRKKEERIDASLHQIVYVTRDDYILLCNNNYYPLAGRRSIIKLFPHSKDRIKKFLRDNQIKIRNASDEQLKTVMNYCDQL